MKLIDYSVHEFVKELDSASPAPGGGSASAFATAMGMGLSRMIGHLTIPKKKFKALEDNIQSSFIRVHESFKEKQRRALELLDEDTEAFNGIMRAFKMPKDTDEDKQKRKKAIEKATYRAIDVPFEIATLSHEALKDMYILVKHGNKNAISDIGVSALLLYAGLEGALLNVKINLSGLTDDAYVKTTSETTKKLLKEGNELKNNILEDVHNAIG